MFVQQHYQDQKETNSIQVNNSNYSLDKMSPKSYIIRDKAIMKNSAMQLIKRRINKMDYNIPFVISDFTDIADYENVKKCLQRLAKERYIRRIIRGIYDKPFYLEEVNEFVAPYVGEVAKAIARNFNWTIAPGGLTSLNYLGLSTQVVGVYEYNSTGPSKTYKIGKLAILFKHKSPKELLNLSYKSSVVVQAVKEIGANIDEKSISRISRTLSSQDKTQLLKESRGVTKWIFNVLKKICSEENKNVQQIKTT